MSSEGVGFSVYYQMLTIVIQLLHGPTISACGGRRLSSVAFTAERDSHAAHEHAHTYGSESRARRFRYDFVRRHLRLVILFVRCASATGKGGRCLSEAHNTTVICDTEVLN